VDTNELAAKFLFPFVLQSVALQPKNSCINLNFFKLETSISYYILKKVFFKLMGVISRAFL